MAIGNETGAARISETGAAIVRATYRRLASRETTIGFGVALVCLAVTCAVADRLGADLNWDLLNYHFYNGFLYSHGRLLTDSLGEEQSYLDPILNDFYYRLIAHDSPRTASLAIAALQSLSLTAVFLLARRLFRAHPPRVRGLIAAVATGAALIGPIFWSEIGGTMSDSLLAALVIFALLALVASLRPDGTPIVSIGTAGLLVGLASGFKFTNMTYAVAGFAALLIIPPNGPRTIRTIAVRQAIFCAAAVAGFVAIYAPIGWPLWEKFRNPIFPYFNNVFHSPDRAFDAVRDPHYPPQTWLGYVELPFQYCVRHFTKPPGHLIGMEIPFRNQFYAAILIVLLASLIRRLCQASSRPMNRDAAFVIAFFFTGLVTWEIMFAYYRYSAGLELIAPLTLGLLLASWLPAIPRPGHTTLIAAIILLLALTQLPDANWGREPFATTYFGLTKTSFSRYRNALIIAGYTPIGFALPYFPPTDRFIALRASIPGLTAHFRHSYLQRLDRSQGRIYLLTRADPTHFILHVAQAALRRRYGLVVNEKSCATINSTVFPMIICAAARQDGDLR